MLLIALALIVVVGSFPAAWLLMLFLGNVGLAEVSFFGALPGGILITFFVAGGASGGGYWSRR